MRCSCLPLLLCLLPSALLSEPSGAALTADGFAIPQPGRSFSFPRDHGSHAEFRTEWWYVTGHLKFKARNSKLETQGSAGRKAEASASAPAQTQTPASEFRASNFEFPPSDLTFQATFFRQAKRHASDKVEQLHLAHMALLEVDAQRFYHDERLNSAGWDAAAASERLAIQQGNWSLRAVENSQDSAMQLDAAIHADVALALRLLPQKGLVIFGKEGVSRKGSAASAASHYLTWPRLAVSGSVTLADGQAREVSGQAWMDHEFSSSQLDEGQVGWDWASVQLDDGREIMVYRMRRADGSTDAASSLTWIDSAGKLSSQPHDAFGWEALSTWTSPRTQARYPNEVRLTTRDPQTQQSRVLTLRPLALDQEQGGELSGLPYWEGGCDVLDEQGKPVGHAFLELAGYAGDLAKHLRAAEPSVGGK